MGALILEGPKYPGLSGIYPFRFLGWHDFDSHGGLCLDAKNRSLCLDIGILHTQECRYLVAHICLLQLQLSLGLPQLLRIVRSLCIQAYLGICMEAFVIRKAVKGSSSAEIPSGYSTGHPSFGDEDEPTEVKIAILASLHPSLDQDVLLDLLIAENGSVDAVSESLSAGQVPPSSRKRSAAGIGHQSSLSSFRLTSHAEDASPVAKRRTLTRKGQTLHLYTPEDIANHTPCSIIHNFLPAGDAEKLLRELLEEAPTYERSTFKLFDNVVQSPHSACFYVENPEEEEKQKTEYLYNGSFLTVSIHSNVASSVLLTGIRMFARSFLRCVLYLFESRRPSIARSLTESSASIPTARN